MEVSKFPRKTWGAVHARTVCSFRLMKLDSSTCICNKKEELVITHTNSVHKFDDHMQMYHLSKPGELRMCKQFAPDAPSDFLSA